MATDATGAPTALGIPKFNTSVDAPSGLGSNAQMDAIDALIQARVASPAAIVSGEVPVWNGSAWVRSSVTNVGPTSLGSGTPDNTKFLRGDGTWGQVADAQVAAGAAIQRSKLERNLTLLTLSASQSIANGTQAALVWDTEAADDQNQHPAGANATVTIARTGLYQIVFDMAWANVSGGDRFAGIYINTGSGFTFAAGDIRPRDGIFGTAYGTVSLIVSLASGNSLQAQVQQTSGVAVGTAFGGIGGPTLAVLQL